MTQYINKAAVVAEIERRKKTWSHQDQQYVNGGKDVCDYLLGFLDTLEVIEIGVDLGDPKGDTGTKTVFNDSKVLEISRHGNSHVGENGDLEEAAKKAGQKYFPNENNIWARTNYEAMAAANAFKEGYLAGQEKIITKACEWLADNYSKYIITNGLATIFSATIDFDTIRMIEDFKKSMEK